MFKEAVASGVGTVFGAAKDGVKAVGADVMRDGLRAVTARSPLAAAMVDSVRGAMSAKAQLKAKQEAETLDYINSTDTSDLQKAVADNNPGASEEKINAEMFKILNNLRAMIDKRGVEETKQSESFKKYSSHFEKYIQYIQTSATKSEKSNNKESTHTTPGNNVSEMISEIKDTIFSKVFGQTDTSKYTENNNTSSEEKSDKQVVEELKKANSFLKAMVPSTEDKIEGRKKSTGVEKAVTELKEKTQTSSDSSESIVSKVLSMIPEGLAAGAAGIGAAVLGKKVLGKVGSIMNRAPELTIPGAANPPPVPPTKGPLALPAPTTKAGDITDAVIKSETPKGAPAPIVKKPGGLGTAIKNGGSKFLKGAGALAKRIPGIGLLLGAGFAASRAMDGDFTGAGLELASGVASTVPGIGTAASIGIDAALMAKDADAFNAIAAAPARAAAIDTMATKAEEATKESNKPIVINNQISQPQTSQTNQGPVIITPSTVRNQDSTFSRVQAQDYWSRTA